MITYRATLDVADELALYLSRLLVAERRRRGYQLGRENPETVLHHAPTHPLAVLNHPPLDYLAPYNTNQGLVDNGSDTETRAPVDRSGSSPVRPNPRGEPSTPDGPKFPIGNYGHFVHTTGKSESFPFDKTDISYINLRPRDGDVSSFRQRRFAHPPPGQRFTHDQFSSAPEIR